MSQRKSDMVRNLVLTLSFVLVAGLTFAACGGGGGGSIPQQVGGTGPGGNQENEIIPGGPTENPLAGGINQTPPRGEELPPTPDQPAEPVLDEFPDSILRLPKDNRGEGQITIRNFDQQEKILLVTINQNPRFRNYRAGTLPEAPVSLPMVDYYLTASVELPRNTAGLDQMDEAGGNLLIEGAQPVSGLDQPYYGLVVDDLSKVEPDILVERERRALIEQGRYRDIRQVLKSTSSLDLGAVRSFSRICRSTFDDLPTDQSGNIIPTIPNIYFWQQGRLVAQGQHVYIFLSTEINNGFPDGVRFTQARLNRLAQTFDEKILPNTFDGLIPPELHDEFRFVEDNIYFAPPVPLGQLQFDEQGNITNFNPEQLQIQDKNIENDHKFIIFIYNQKPNTPGAQGSLAFFVPGVPAVTAADCGIPIEGQQPQDVDINNFSGITMYMGNTLGVFPANSDDWRNAEAVLAHEFQHVLNNFYRMTNTRWMNEGMSNLNTYINGYTISSGASNVLLSQINGFLAQPNFVPSHGDEAQGPEVAAYGARFLLMLYIMEHYPPGTIPKLYRNAWFDPTLAADPIRNIEVATGEKFESIFQKFALAVVIDSLPIKEGGLIAGFTDFKGNPWLKFQLIDLKGNFGTSPTGLNGANIEVLPDNPDLYPIVGLRRSLKPWTMDYVMLTNGTGGNLNITITSVDPNYQTFILPLREVTNPQTGEVSLELDDDVQIP